MALKTASNVDLQKDLQEESSDETPDNSEAESAVESDSSDETQTEGNAGWANSIAKVLGTTKPKTKKNLVLSRAKKISVKKDNEDPGFEIEPQKDFPASKDKPKNENKAIEPTKSKIKNLQLDLRVKPSLEDLERERTFKKVATKGVVQLFNAVRSQQTELKEQLDNAGPLGSRKDAVLNNINKRKFLDVLMGGKRSKSENVDNPINYDSDDDSKGGEKKKSEWSVLRPDFMTNKKIKHWDEEESDEQSNDGDSDESNGSDDK